MSTTTMTKSAMIRARVEPELKEQAEDVLKQIGLSMSDLVSMTMRQLVMRQGLPFDARIPNAETIAAIEEFEADKKAGRLALHNTSDDMFAALDAEAGGIE